MIDILGLQRPDLGDALERLGVGRVHTDRVFSAIHRERCALDRIDGLGARKSRLLAGACRLPDVRIARADRSECGTEKLVFALRDGAAVEGVLIPNGDRTTLCVSSQVGCAMDCAFCATGRLGLDRGLDPAEIVAQVQLARRRAGRLHNLVFMGMGEPLHHYERTARAIRLLTDHHGLMQPLKSITVSTVGRVPGIRRLAADFDGRIQLAISLNAGTDATRAKLMPVAARWSMEELRRACDDYPLRSSRRHLLVEYALLAGVNDTPRELEGVARWTRGLSCLVNLIPWNPVAGAAFETPDDAAVERARQTLDRTGCAVTVRRPRGRRVGAACGQLALQAPWR